MGGPRRIQLRRTSGDVDRAAAVAAFRTHLAGRATDRLGYPSDDEVRAALKGRDLACWCPLDGPCHADVLLEIANR